jgi:hypothetical protein
MPGRIVIYTANVGDYDEVRVPIKSAISDGVEYVYYSDREVKTHPWRWVQVVRQHGMAVMDAKRFKIQPHRHLDTKDYWCAYSVWQDANLRLRVKITRELLDDWLGDNDIAVFAHPDRKCIYQEAKAVNQLALDRKHIVDLQMARYRREGYPKDNGLAACWFIVRRHTPQIAQLNMFWWREIQSGSRRDQLSFNYACWKLGVKYSKLPGKLSDVASYARHKARREVRK